MEKIKAGVIGYGLSGKVFQCPFLEAHEAFELTAIVQRHGDEAKEDYPDITLYRDYKEMLEDDTIELVVVSTPVNLHFEHAKAALEKGKHVLLEKPFAATYEEAETLVELAKEKNLIVTVYQNRRYDGDYLTMKKIVQDPEVQVYELEAVWDRYKPTIENKWKETDMPGCGLLFDLGPHFLDQALTLFGKPDKIDGVAKRLRPGSRAIDYFSILLDYPDKVVRLKSTLTAAKPDIRYKLHTSKGTYHFYVMGEQEPQLRGGMKPDDPEYGDNAMYDFYDGEGGKTSLQVEKGNYLDYFTKLAEAIRTGSEPPVMADEALELIRLLEAVRDGSN